MESPLDLSAERCGCTRGVILVTPCTATAVDRCGRCGLPLCAEHATPLAAAIVCPACAEAAHRRPLPGPHRRDRDDPRRDDQASPPFDVPGDPGESLAPTSTTDPAVDDDLFTPEDYDAFDRAGDVDMNAGIDDGFDS